jgi:hypothetical protein
LKKPTALLLVNAIFLATEMVSVELNVMSLSRAIVVGSQFGALLMAALSSLSFLTCIAFSKEVPVAFCIVKMHENKEINKINIKETNNKLL